jgi:nitrogen fixation protein NifQ
MNIELIDTGYDRLMAQARNPADIPTQAFAGVIGFARTQAAMPPHRVLRLSAERYAVLLERYFPQAGHTTVVAGAADDAGCPALDNGEFDDLLDLLLAHRSRRDEPSEWLARAVAAACLGNNHLWQDLGLPNRQVLSDLLQQHFTALYARNTGNMKWKKFFYKQLCERAEVNLCKAPSCKVCSDYAQCFGPE